MALLRSPRLSQAVAVFVLGVAACGVSIALAGTTPRPPRDPIDDLPVDVEKVRDVPCTRDALSAVLPTTTAATLPGASRLPCWHMALVWSTRDGSNQLADRVAQHYRARGFDLKGPTTGSFRSYYGTLPACGTILAIDTGTEAASTPPGARSTLPALDAGAGLPGGSPSGPAGVVTSTVPGATGAVGPGMSLPGATGGPPVSGDPSVTGPAIAGGPGAGPPVDPAVSPDQLLLQDPFSTPYLLARPTYPAMALVSVQQSLSVVPDGAAGRC